MEKLFYPKSIVIYGLSPKEGNIPRLILENLLRWEFKGRIFGVNPSGAVDNVKGVKLYKNVSELPIVPDLAVTLVPAKYIPGIVDDCGKFGIKWMAIPSGGFNEHGEEGQVLADLLMAKTKEYGIRFVGPNGITVANTKNGLCLPFVPSFSPPKGGLSIITQSGGVGLMLWNLMENENVGMAKFASIGNKLDLDEVDFLEYFGQDPETKIIGLYLESITRGKELVEAAAKIDKPIILFKSNTTEIGNKAAMSHTAALSNNDDVIDSAFERSGIIRINNFSDFTSVAKAFILPPMRGNKIMIMSPAGGFTVMMGDLCEKLGFEFADPGQEFYDRLNDFSNAGVINFSNPLDMGDIYDPQMYAHITYELLHNDNVDALIYTSQWPHMPKGINVFYSMFQTDLSKESIGSMLSANKPLGVCLFGLSATMAKMKVNSGFPIFDSIESMIRSFKFQSDYYAKKSESEIEYKEPENMNIKKAGEWLSKRDGVVGEDTLELLSIIGINVPDSDVVSDESGAVNLADKIGYPVVMKIVSPDAVHKSDAGGVLIGLKNKEEVKKGFATIKENLFNYKKNAEFTGVRVMAMADDGYDMFIGGNYDEAFGPVVFFGMGGVTIEVFKDVENVLAPSYKDEIASKVKQLKSFKMLDGFRGNPKADIDLYVDFIERVAYLLGEFPEIKELDINPLRLLKDGSGAIALDARIRIER